jgi:nucleotide-binding universal stress UspA family protein
VPVGFKHIRLHISLNTDATSSQREKLLALTERYGVVYQTLLNGSKITMTLWNWALFDARMNALTLRHAHTVPAILANAGENAATKFLEFFAARIRNLNTREAYARACAQFLAWSENHVSDIRAITPMHSKYETFRCTHRQDRSPNPV